MTALVERLAPTAQGLRAHERLLVDAWLVALLVDRLAFPFDAARPLGIASLLLTLIALIGRSPRVAAGAFALDAAKLVLLMPDMANHLTALFFVDVLLVGYLLWPRAVSTVAVMQPIRIMALLLYAVAAVHKMNASFLDAATSCATYIANSTLSWFWLPTLGAGLGTVTAFSALAIEAALPVFLVIRRTRRAAVLGGLAFHGSLAFAPIIGVASFSVFMMASYVAFFDEEMVARLTLWRRVIPQRLLEAAPRQRLVVAASVALAVTGVNRVAPDASFLLARVLGVVVCFTTLALLVRRGTATRATDFETVSETRRLQPFTAVVAVCILTAAVAPYFGGRTQLSFSMFSNLRTETAGNHLFIPKVDLFDIQGDLVTIVESPSPRFDDISGRALVVPSYEVGRRLALLDGIDSLTVLEDGVEVTYAGSALRERFPEPGRVSGWLFRLRATEIAGPVSCRH